MADDEALDERYKLAYEEAKRAVQYQQDVLRALRGRAGNLITIASAVTSFSVGVGLIRTDSTNEDALPMWAAYVLLVLLVGIGIMSLTILWPTRWNFTVNAKALLEGYIEPPQSRPVTQLYRYIAIELQRYYDLNRSKLHRRNNAYRWGAMLLLVEVAVLVFAIR